MDISGGNVGKARPVSREFIESDKPTIILYHAVWCHFCKEFMATWNDLKEKLKDIAKFKDYEESEMEQLDPPPVGIEGFPTIVKKVGKKEYIYEGDRTYDALKQWIEKGTAQSGGGVKSEEYYKMKYYKYKTKYLNLVNQLS